MLILIQLSPFQQSFMPLVSVSCPVAPSITTPVSCLNSIIYWRLNIGWEWVAFIQLSTGCVSFNDSLPRTTDLKVTLGKGDKTPFSSTRSGLVGMSLLVCHLASYTLLPQAENPKLQILWFYRMKVKIVQCYQPAINADNKCTWILFIMDGSQFQGYCDCSFTLSLTRVNDQWDGSPSRVHRIWRSPACCLENVLIGNDIRIVHTLIPEFISKIIRVETIHWEKWKKNKRTERRRFGQPCISMWQ